MVDKCRKLSQSVKSAIIMEIGYDWVHSMLSSVVAVVARSNKVTSGFSATIPFALPNVTDTNPWFIVSISCVVSSHQDRETEIHDHDCQT